MQFAIVDIETTGGNPMQGGITEIAVLVHNGEKVMDSFHTLLNPQRSIPGFITGLTGIDQKMVEDAPIFSEVAVELFHFLKDRVFVAHNVNFDYSFLKEALRKEGLILDVPKLCTVRLSRKTFQGFRSYSLGRICEQMDIQIHNRHRAYGDAEATAILFGRIFQENSELVLHALKRNNGEAFLPPNISKEQYLAFPESTGIYYFHDSHGKVIYVGKALNIRSRFKAHFTGKSREQEKLSLGMEIHEVSWELTGSEFLAFLLELLEIKRLWPKYNVAQKFRKNNWGLVSYEDGSGYVRLLVSKIRSSVKPVQSFDSHSAAWKFLLDNVETFGLCPKLSGVQKTPGVCYDFKIQKCRGACCGKEDPADYNFRVSTFLNSLKNHEGKILIREKGRTMEEETALLFENGVFSAYGFIDKTMEVSHPSDVVNSLRKVIKLPESSYILRTFLSQIPMHNIQMVKDL